MRGVTFRLLLALCLIASTAQGFVAQTHVHARPPVASAAAGQAMAAVADSVTREETPCVLCDIAGHSPAAAPPAQPLIVILHPQVRVAPAVTTAPVFVTAASHHWRGRAPPTV